MIHDIAMSRIGNQLRRAQQKDYVTELNEDSATIFAVFSPNLRQLTVDIVLRCIEQKYGKFVVIIINEENRRQVEIINRLRFCVDVV